MLGEMAVAMQTDVANDLQVKATVAQTVVQFGRIDTLVNNAALTYRWKASTSSTALSPTTRTGSPPARHVRRGPLLIGRRARIHPEYAEEPGRDNMPLDAARA